MTSQAFPNVEQILTLMMGELPTGVYPMDRADDPDPNKRSTSSAELRAHAQLLANLYQNLDDIDSDKAITTITPAGLSPWERDLFSAVQDSALSFATRQNNLFAKYRASGGLSLPAISSIVHGLLDPLGLTFDILPYSGQFNGTTYGAWILGSSQLGLDTYLGLLDPLEGAGVGLGVTALDCNLDYAAAGLTLLQLQQIQATAYTYEVRIYGIADANTLALLDRSLTGDEPARSTHVIRNNAPGPVAPNIIDFGQFTATDLADAIDFGLFVNPSATYDVWDFGSF